MKRNYVLSKILPDSIFRTNDVRGNVNTELTPNVVYSICHMFGLHAREENQKKILLAMDGRISSPALYDAATQGLLEANCKVEWLGLVPTPVLYFATYTTKIHSGIMITGSHNPPEENGLKFILNKKIFSGLKIQMLKNNFDTTTLSRNYQLPNTFEILPDYYEAIIKNIDICKQLKIVVDAGNSIVGKIFVPLAKKIGCNVIELYCDIDGKFPNHFPDPVVPENMIDLCNKVKSTKADVGIAFDGDGDRLGVVTNAGKIVHADRILMLFAKKVLQNFPNSTVIYDVKCTRFMDKWVSHFLGKPIMWKTGHAQIKEKMLSIQDAKLAGEMSGHFYFQDKWFGFDDGLYAAARLLEILSQENRDLETLLSDMPNSISTPELRIAVSEERKQTLIQQIIENFPTQYAKINTLDGLRADFDFGFGLIRPSNTTSCLIARFEADTETQLKEIKDLFRRVIQSIDQDLALPF